MKVDTTINFICDGCGDVGRAEAKATAFANLPEGWGNLSYPNAGTAYAAAHELCSDCLAKARGAVNLQDAIAQPPAHGITQEAMVAVKERVDTHLAAVAAAAEKSRLKNVDVRLGDSATPAVDGTTT